MTSPRGRRFKRAVERFPPCASASRRRWLKTERLPLKSLTHSLRILGIIALPERAVRTPENRPICVIDSSHLYPTMDTYLDSYPPGVRGGLIACRRPRVFFGATRELPNFRTVRTRHVIESSRCPEWFEHRDGRRSMDAARFDRLTKRLSETETRRRVLGLLSGSARCGGTRSVS